MTTKDLEELREIICAAQPTMHISAPLMSNEALAIRGFSRRLCEVIDERISKRSRSTPTKRILTKPEKVGRVVKKKPTIKE